MALKVEFSRNEQRGDSYEEEEIYTLDSTYRATSLARTAADRAVFPDPQNSVARGILGSILVYEGKPIKADAELKLALSVNPNHADVWMFIADSHVMQGRVGEGLACARNAFQVNPHPPSFYYCGLEHLAID